MVHFDAAFGEQLFDVAVGEAKAQVPADRQHDHIRREAETGEGRPWDGIGGGRGEFSYPQSGCSGLLTADATAPSERRCRLPTQTPTRNGGSAPFAPSVWTGYWSWGAGHLERTLKVYIAHYNAHRPHRALQLEPPDPAAPVTLISGHPPARVHRRDLLGGLLHEYQRAA